jgi:hypothetical protein
MSEYILLGEIHQRTITELNQQDFASCFRSIWKFGDSYSASRTFFENPPPTDEEKRCNNIPRKRKQSGYSTKKMSNDIEAKSKDNISPLFLFFFLTLVHKLFT